MAEFAWTYEAGLLIRTDWVPETGYPIRGRGSRTMARCASILETLQPGESIKAYGHGEGSAQRPLRRSALGRRSADQQPATCELLTMKRSDPETKRKSRRWDARLSGSRIADTKEILADIANFTKAQASIRINELLAEKDGRSERDLSNFA
jgi:hypothetical protein